MSIFKRQVADIQAGTALIDKITGWLTQPALKESEGLTPSESVKLWYQTAYMPVKDRIKVPSLWPPPDKKFFKIIALLEAAEKADDEATLRAAAELRTMMPTEEQA